MELGKKKTNAQSLGAGKNYILKHPESKVLHKGASSSCPCLQGFPLQALKHMSRVSAKLKDC